MIIKLDTSLFRLSRAKDESLKKEVRPLTKTEWINADRIVMAVLFLIAIVGSIIF
ncbi:hypothetical protein [Pedobacter punctiformis]|uniref:Uncharacterized protein n=1 Tax=Pedobacter punctiformis TaxID=3004097 RepID=A0ABT4LBK2_9SPHI|nr:hypothetical protein [Pedobacter sp. HCMS5-2]MCZ4245290.1 hypothetical protein [Pedobacter sp. HCMS5-2]